MANYDAGHYFLTFMAPIPREGVVETKGVRRSAVDHIRYMITTLPTAQQDPPSIASGLQSPFARVPGTHFAHLFVIDDVRYNGREPSSPIKNLIFNVKMTDPEHIDHLPDPYLVLAVDFDAPDGSAESLRAYTDRLWQHMGGELALVFGPTSGFDAVRDAASFHEFVCQGQIDTNLPFNDYWAHEVTPPSPVPWMGAASFAVLAGAVVLSSTGIWSASFWGLFALTVLALLVVNIAIIAKFGLTPFPAAPDSDLQSVLKAVYIQQMFTGFAIDALGKTDAELQDAFDGFCRTHMPQDKVTPTQAPGVLQTKWSPPQ